MSSFQFERSGRHNQRARFPFSRQSPTGNYNEIWLKRLENWDNHSNCQARLRGRYVATCSVCNSLCFWHWKCFVIVRRMFFSNLLYRTKRDCHRAVKRGNFALRWNCIARMLLVCSKRRNMTLAFCVALSFLGMKNQSCLVVENIFISLPSSWNEYWSG